MTDNKLIVAMYFAIPFQELSPNEFDKDLDT